MDSGNGGKIIGFGGALAAALLLLAAPPARSALVTLVAPIRTIKLYSPLPEILRDLPEIDPCASADKAVYALESSIVVAQAQHWAYLMKQPEFSVDGLAVKPGMDISHSDLREIFYKELAFWFAQDAAPDLTAESLSDVNDVSMRIRLVRGMCR